MEEAMATAEMGQGLGVLSQAAVMVAEAKRDLDRLDLEFEQHVAEAQGAWVGTGSTAFQRLGAAWSERQRSIVSALDRFESALRATERENTSTDEAQSAAFSRTQRRLG
jgi:uncharacterized protein YukE